MCHCSILHWSRFDDIIHVIRDPCDKLILTAISKSAHATRVIALSRTAHIQQNSILIQFLAVLVLIRVIILKSDEMDCIEIAGENRNVRTLYLGLITELWRHHAIPRKNVCACVNLTCNSIANLMRICSERFRRLKMAVKRSDFIVRLYSQISSAKINMSF